MTEVEIIGLWIKINGQTFWSTPEKMNTQETKPETTTEKVIIQEKRTYKKQNKRVKPRNTRPNTTYNYKYGLHLTNEEIDRVLSAIIGSPGIKREALMKLSSSPKGRIQAIIDTLKNQQKINHKNNKQGNGYIYTP